MPHVDVQGSSIWVRYTKMQRYFLPEYNPLERLLVALNFVQNIVFFFVVNTPLLLRVAHEVLYGTGIPVPGFGKYVLGYAVLLQLVYDAYWTTRLWNSFFKCVNCCRWLLDGRTSHTRPSTPAMNPSRVALPLALHIL